MLRRVALTAALAALLAPAGPAEAAKKKVKQPVVSSVTPMTAEVGDTLTIRGRNFKKGKGRNTVIFRRSGGKALFVKAGVATPRRLYVQVPDRLAQEMGNEGASKVPTTFQIRILSARLGRAFTPAGKSPKIGPNTAKAAVTPTSPPDTGAGATASADGDCDGDGSKNKEDADDDNDGLTDTIEKSLGLDPCKADTDGDGVGDKKEVDCDLNGVLNRDQADDDSDMLDDALEAKIMTDPCSADSDGDRVTDAYEYKSAIDLNDDEYQQPNTAYPYPGKRPYPNPLDSSDANYDHDGDGLSMKDEFELWKYTYEVAGTGGKTLFPLSYSAGMQYSVHAVCKAPYPAGTPCGTSPNSEGRRYPTLKVEGYERWFGPNGFYTWLGASGYQRVVLGWAPENPPYFPGMEFHILDANLSGSLSDGGWTTIGVPDFADTEGEHYSRSELYAFALDKELFMSDEERDEDADGLSNYDEISGRMVRTYWEKCYSSEVPFPAYPGQPTHPLSAYDADTDGDGVRDGADDEDHDDVPNIMEISRIAASGYDDTDDGSKVPAVPEGAPRPVPTVGLKGPAYDSCKVDAELPPYKADRNKWHEDEYGRVQPFNPCLPLPESRTCPRVSEFTDKAYPPFDESGMDHWWSLQ